MCKQDDSSPIVIKIDQKEVTPLIEEAKINKLLDDRSPYTTKMIYSSEHLQDPTITLFDGNGERKVKAKSFLVTPYIGPSLIDLLIKVCDKRNPKPLTLEAKRYICSQIVTGVSYLHRERRLAHLDLKPDNFVVSKDLHFSLIDFGMSSLIGVSQTSKDKMTPNYRAPEITQSN